MTALALTAAMVAGMAAPAYADVYYIGDGNITITKDESGTYVKHANSKDKTKGDLDNGEITIKGGKRSEDTPAPGSGSSEGTTPAKSPAKSMSATPPSEDSENNDMVYLGDTKGSGEENKNQTGDTTGGEENENQTGGTTGGEKNETDFTKKTQPSRSPVLESQITYTGPSLNVADANDDEETPNESTTALKRAAENFRNTAENVTNYVIRIINKATGNDNTLNVTLKDVNIDASSSKTNDAALSVEGAGDTKITLVGDNKLTSGNQCAGLEHNEESTGTTGKLTITSGTDKNGNNTGSLTATGSGASAGIGSVTFFLGSGAGIIEIAGGTITEAIGGDGGAGIGSGANSFGTTTVNITSGTVKAQGGDYGAGIGGGDNSRNTNITISGGTIEEAVGGSTGDGIGGGNNSSNITVTIQGGTIKKAQGGKGNFYAGHGIHSDSTLNISGKAFIQNAKGGDGGTEGGSGIRRRRHLSARSTTSGSP